MAVVSQAKNHLIVFSMSRTQLHALIPKTVAAVGVCGATQSCKIQYSDVRYHIVVEKHICLLAIFLFESIIQFVHVSEMSVNSNHKNHLCQ